MDELTQELMVALRKIVAQEEPYYSPESKKKWANANPYRCPKCKGNLDRYNPTKKRPVAAGFHAEYVGVGFSCPKHGDVHPFYDESRYGREGPGPDCGCGWNSGPYRIPCAEHDPVAIAEVALDRVPAGEG